MPLNPPAAEGAVWGAEAFAVSVAEAVDEGADICGVAAGLKVIV
jgi:hypothetical protein